MIDAIRTRRHTVADETPPGGTGGSVPIDFQRLERLRRLARLMDTRWRIPFTRIPVGLDGIASLVPVAGDTVTAIVSAYIIMEAARFDLPKTLVARMVFNVLLDWAGGSVPVLGTVFDIAFKANRMNLNLLHEHLEQRLAAVAAKR
ncbi:hypothetical protein J2848_001727 [Azospirillum lipoferum]|uniref:DUF4112 domain-containing protein n=1 Tax=Azospirillum lipoferum TaxID=193 RepID=A0A5A9GTL5_AZOLI|nr:MULTISPECIES: DUF4112 domain-containing protein [Azospirillum]KAA0597791.1 DUF4112 domain-containing protein [Azospirillum lipoferum]MCP1610068.1 hypothetical protein [Azospirillum lipoferum]MDW5534439.1 DUF4112 domain-containing protein [Azospirillum sp. NL1]